jgi:hypothetical protein
MSREADAIRFESEPTCDFDVEDGQGDGQPSATREDFAEVAIARITVLFLVSAKALEFEKGVVERGDGGAWRIRRIDQGPSSVDQFRDEREASLDVEIRSNFGREYERPLGQPELAFRQVSECLESV